MGLLKQKRDLFLVYFAPTNKTISLMIVKNLLIRANYRKVVKNRLRLKGFHFKDTFYSNQSNRSIFVQSYVVQNFTTAFPFYFIQL